MKFTVNQVFNAVQALDTIMREKRSMPQISKFKLARMHAKLLPEFAAANAQRDELIAKHGEMNEGGVMQVPLAKMPEFNAEWAPLGDHEVDVDVEPMKITDLFLANSAGGEVNGEIEASELSLLGDLITE